MAVRVDSQEVVRQSLSAVDGPFYLVWQWYGFAVRNAKHQCVGVLEWKDGRKMSPMEIEAFIGQVAFSTIPTKERPHASND